MRPDQIRRVVQRERHCGPAVIEMLYSFYGVDTSQEEIAALTGLTLEQITENGASILHLTESVNRMNKGYVLLVRYDSTINDIIRLHERCLPVGVEWRCEFLEPDGVLWGEGHYSIIVGVDPQRRMLTLLDPHNGENISHRSGMIRFEDFEQRWWDENWFPVLGEPGKLEQIFTEGLVFILVPTHQASEFETMGFQPMTAELPTRHRARARLIALPTRPDGLREQV